MEDIVTRFCDLFRGSPYAHGVSRTTGEFVKGKSVCSGSTEHTQADVGHWRKHLEGRVGLGVIACTDIGRSWFGALDIDDYKMDRAAAVRKVYDLDIGGIPCNSKSGGLHVYFFFDGVRTSDVRAFLKHVMDIIGYPGKEIFPKQDESRPDNVGNWINMPFFNMLRDNCRHGYTRDMKVINAPAFLNMTNDVRQSAARLYTNSVKLALGGPKCIVDVFRNGTVYGEGVRHEMRKKYIGYLMGKDIEDKEETCLWFANLATPGDPHEDVLELIRGWENQGFKFVCFLGKCELACGQKKDVSIGPSDLDGDPKVTIYKTVPPIYILGYPEKPAVKLSLDDLLSRERTKKMCVAMWDCMVKMPPAKEWDRRVGEWLTNAERIIPPDASSATGELAVHVETYCRGGCSSKEPSRKRAWIIDDHHWFTVEGLMAYLETKRFKSMERHQVSCWLFQRDAETGAARIDGRLLDTLSLPLYDGAAYTPPAKEAREVI